MKSNAAIAWDYSDNMLFVVHRPGVMPSDAEWRGFMTDVRAQRGLRAVVVLANDTRLAPTHRSEIQKWYQDNKARAALLTDSVMTRGIMTMLNWFGVEMRSFAPDDVHSALAFLQLPADRWAHAQNTLRVLSAGLGDQRSTTAAS
jgi:hypothetical protein